MKFFKFFPTFEYEQTKLTNILVRTKLRDIVRKNTVVFYPYVVPEGERPDTLSHKYYGSVNFTWLIFYANEIFDPILEWPLSYSEFNAFLEKKYGNLEYPQITVKEYYNKSKRIVDYDTWLTYPDNERSSITIYDWELEKNEAKRQILLIDNDYAETIQEELKTALKV